MECIRERIINIADLEAKIQSARICSDSVLVHLRNNDNYTAEYFARNLSLKLHELTEFEFVLEQRKVISKDSE